MMYAPAPVLLQYAHCACLQAEVKLAEFTKSVKGNRGIPFRWGVGGVILDLG